MGSFCDAFISYGRADSKGFATKLQTRLLEEGFNAWFDQNDIPLGVDFQNQIDDGIEKAHNFLFIIAPHSINSPYCRKEIELAIKRNKRIIPLLHVEQINYDTWQQRYPKGTPEEWETYKAKGLHSSFPNMHPLIGKINWVYFREDLDNFDKSFADLITLIRHHADYAEQHTYFLTKALEWERNQRKTNYLLIGEERKQAESWLKIRFKDEQAPCVPSDLHCEYITESIKNANNLMTQVFLSYADEDKATMEKVRNSLRREMITVWTNKTDIQTGEAFEDAINRGIEQADNLVFLISPDSVTSYYCQQELDYALSFNKRIIPLLVRDTNTLQIPESLRQLHYIDLSDNAQDEDYHLDESQLLKILHQDETYYNEHKMLLTKALKWERQNRNSSILLRGYNLRHAELWLKGAEQRKKHPPTALQKEYISESLQQPTDVSVEVFISYCPADSDFARQLNEALQIQGKTTWFDQESIAEEAEFKQEIERGIQNSDNFLLIISPQSLDSSSTTHEVKVAQRLNKRLVIVLYKGASAADLDPTFANIQQVDFTQNNGDFYTNFSELVRTLDTDREHVKSHTKWSQRALEWEHKEKTADLLLRGNEFAIAETWLQETEQEKKQPPATALQKEYITASRDAIAAEIRKEKRRVVILKSLLAFATIAFLVSVVAAVFAFRESRKALRDQIESLTASSSAEFALGKDFNALLIGLKAAKELRTPLWIPDKHELEAKVVTALQQSISKVRELNRLEGHQGAINELRFSPDGQTIATASDDRTVKLWSLDGKELRTLEGHRKPVYLVRFSPDGKMIATGSDDKTVKLWQPDGTLIVTLTGHKKSISDVEFSPDGKTIATASEDSTVKLWRLDGTLIVTLKDQTLKDTAHESGISDVEFSPDGKTIATARWDSTVKLWDLKGKLLHTLKGEDISGVFSISFSPDGKTIASANFNNTVILWNREKGIRQRTLKGHTGLIYYVTFSPDGKTIATASGDKTIKLWDSSNGKLLHSLEGHNEWVHTVTFSPDSKTIATASLGKTVKIWGLDGTLITNLTGHNNTVSDVKFSPDGNTIATASWDRTVKLWNLDNPLVTTLTRAESNDQFLGFDPTPISFSPKGQEFVTSDQDGSLQLWGADGKEISTLVEASKHSGGIFSPDGQSLVTMDDNSDYGDIYSDNEFTLLSVYGGTLSAKLWKADGTFITTLFEKDKGDFVSVSFSPDSQTLVTTQGNGAVKLWKTDGNLIATLIEKSENSPSVSFSPDGQTLVTTEYNGAVKLWNNSGTEIAELINKIPGSAKVHFSPDNQSLVTVMTDEKSYGPVQLWKIDGTPITTLIEKSEKQNSESEESDSSEVVDVSFSADGQTLAIANNDGSSSDVVTLWKANGTRITTLADQSEGSIDVYFLEKGQILVTSRTDGAFKVWKTDGRLITTLTENTTDESVAVTPSPDGKTFVTVNNKAVELWNGNGTLIKTLQEGKQEENQEFVNVGIDGEAATVKYSSDSKTIAIITQKTVNLWNRDGTLIEKLTHNADVKKASFSPDNQLFVSASADNTVKLWNRITNLNTILAGYTAEITDLHFSPDSKILVSASEKEIVIRPLDNLANLDNLVAKGCERVADYIQTSPNLEDSDRTLCKGIKSQK
ncbi:MAG TPA: type IV secretion protein Rhs [Cyanobacteria bacterium UBA11370]|nr:type IV secretion protein Rhs [Cyanobacteria bacterium UBA11370]HBY81382.1 type IV secretion protein Rhs [Cyanobacteria bacterium UBA11148]